MLKYTFYTAIQTLRQYIFSTTVKTFSQVDPFYFSLIWVKYYILLVFIPVFLSSALVANGNNFTILSENLTFLHKRMRKGGTWVKLFRKKRAIRNSLYLYNWRTTFINKNTYSFIVLSNLRALLLVSSLAMLQPWQVTMRVGN